MNDSNIAVIEGKWFKDKNISVRSLFDLISDLHFGSPHQYHYEMFNNSDALKEIVLRLASTNNIHNIYFAAHGSKEGILGSNEDVISTVKLSNLIKATNDCRGKLDSIYFGSCSFGNSKNLEKLLLSAKGEQIRWIAGYTKEVDFVKSTALDAIFWHEYLEAKHDKDGKQLSTLNRIELVCEEIKRQANGLVKELGFKVIAYNAKRASSICELI